MAKDTDAKNLSLLGASFQLSFSAGRPTAMKNTFHGELNGSKEATYHIMRSNVADGWYYTTVNLTDDGCRYILKADVWAKLKDDFRIIFTNRVEDTLKTWVERNHHNLLDAVTGDLNTDLKKILWDVVRGLKYFKHSLNREHGNLDPSSIFVVSGRGRLGRMSRTGMGPSNDIDSFHHILDFIFPQGIPPEASSSLIHLYHSLKPLPPPQPSAAYEDRIELFYNCDRHVALLSSAEEKSRFRHQALLNVKNQGSYTVRQVEGLLNGRVPGVTNWIQNATNAGVGYKAVLTYRHPYRHTAMSFLNYSRNLVEHAHQHGFIDTLEEIERKLETILPMCLAIFLEAVSIFRIPVNVHLG